MYGIIIRKVDARTNYHEPGTKLASTAHYENHMIEIGWAFILVSSLPNYSQTCSSQCSRMKTDIHSFAIMIPTGNMKNCHSRDEDCHSAYKSGSFLYTLSMLPRTSAVLHNNDKQHLVPSIGGFSLTAKRARGDHR